MFRNILFGSILIIIGFLMLNFRRQVYQFTGKIDFAESKFPGGTYNLIAFTGIVALVLGLAIATGVANGLSSAIFSPFDQVRETIN